jgi:hypothetical protein
MFYPLRHNIEGYVTLSQIHKINNRFYKSLKNLIFPFQEVIKLQMKKFRFKFLNIFP